MQCSLEEIERKRILAQERLAKRKLSSPLKTSSEQVVSPQDIERKRQLALQKLSERKFLSPVRSNPSKSVQNEAPKVPVSKDNPTKSANNYSPLNPVHSTKFYGGQDKVITGNCLLISSNRFTIEIGFHPGALEICKTIASKGYDPQKKSWSFDIADYDLVQSRFTSLQPEVILNKLPLFALRCAKIVDSEVPIDLSKIDEDCRTSLYPYQEEGVCFAIRKLGRCLLGDDMGLGKTIQAIAIAHYYKEDWPLLISTTASMKNVWEENIYKFLPSVSVMKVRYMESGKDHINDCEILIVSHDLMSRCAEKLAKRNFGVIVIDESHILKNFQTQCTKSATLLAKKAKRILLLSGTPALSKPSELFTQLNLIDDKFFGNFYEFSKRYCDGHKSQFGWKATGQSNLQELEVILAKKFMIRRTKESILKNLPNKIQEVVMLDVKLNRFSEEDRKNLSSLADRYNNNKNGRDKHSILLTFFSETARIKIPSVCSYIIQTLEETNKFLVFAHHQVMLDAISRVLTQKRKQFIRIDGNVHGEVRKQLIDRYQTDSSCVCAVLSTTAANAGITLTAGHLVIFAELHWNPSILSQAESRAHRIGQENQVIVKYLIASGTADDSIWPLLQRKQKTLKELGLCKETYESTAVQLQKTSHVESATECLNTNSSVTSANTLDIATYFSPSPKKVCCAENLNKETENKSLEDDFFDDDDMDSLLGNVDLDFV